MSEVHRIRISIDVNSIKEHTFQGLIFVNYDANLKLGIQQPFKTNPPKYQNFNLVRLLYQQLNLSSRIRFNHIHLIQQKTNCWQNSKI